MIANGNRRTGPALAGALMMGVLSMSTTTAAADTVEGIDLNGIRSVVVTGDGSETILDTKGTGLIETEHSGVGSVVCGAHADIRREGDTLVIDIVHRTLGMFLRCDLKIFASLPEGVAVSVTQDAAVVRLDGRFGPISIDAPKAVVRFSGESSDFGVTSTDAVVTARFANEDAAPSVRIRAEKLVADIGYRRDTTLSYSVTAPVALFTSAFTNTPEAGTNVSIQSTLLKGSLYAFNGAS